ncbi:gp436 family protein [Pasteurellaceae bacterium 22721_9_1]
MYISVQDLNEVLSERSLIELSNDSSRATDVNQQVLEKACLHATEIVDGYLRSRYITPLSQVPTIVRNICLQLARYWLYSRRPEGKGFPDNVKETYNQALKDLERIQNGKLHLGLIELSATDDSLPAVAKFQVRGAEKLDLSGY